MRKGIYGGGVVVCDWGDSCSCIRVGGILFG